MLSQANKKLGAARGNTNSSGLNRKDLSIKRQIKNLPKVF